MFRQLTLLTLLAAMLAGCAGDDRPDGSQVRFETTLGDFVVETWPDQAPVTVDNFLQYVADGHYDGLTFHRIAPGFVVQGGGYLPDHETLRETRDPIVNEASANVPNEQWTLSMARTSSPDSATSQFFINLADNANLDKTAGSAGYAVFGEVITGFETIEAMLDVEPGRSFGAGGFWPKTPIVIEKATIITGATPDPSPQPPAAYACPLGPDPAREGIIADLITPGVLCITSTDDQELVWARSFDGDATIDWSLTAEGGLPDGWTATFETPSQELAADGEVHTILRVTVPEGTQGTFDLTLDAGTTSTPIQAVVDLRHDAVSDVDDAVTVEYAGRCVSTGDEFDSGSFPLTLGGGRAIVGFDLGLIGMGWNESASLYLTAPMGYGDDSGPCAGDNADMIFDVTMGQV